MTNASWCAWRQQWPQLVLPSTLKRHPSPRGWPFRKPFSQPAQDLTSCSHGVSLSLSLTSFCPLIALLTVSCNFSIPLIPLSAPSSFILLLTFTCQKSANLTLFWSVENIVYHLFPTLFFLCCYNPASCICIIWNTIIYWGKATDFPVNPPQVQARNPQFSAYFCIQMPAQAREDVVSHCFCLIMTFPLKTKSKSNNGEEIWAPIRLFYSTLLCRWHWKKKFSGQILSLMSRHGWATKMLIHS